MGDQDAAFPLTHRRGDGFDHGTPAPDLRTPKAQQARHMYVRDLHIDSIKVQTWDFR